MHVLRLGSTVSTPTPNTEQLRPECYRSATLRTHTGVALSTAAYAQAHQRQRRATLRPHGHGAGTTAFEGLSLSVGLVMPVLLRLHKR
jgi:hypothetical protein